MLQLEMAERIAKRIGKSPGARTSTDKNVRVIGDATRLQPLTSPLAGRILYSAVDCIVVLLYKDTSKTTMSEAWELYPIVNPALKKQAFQLQLLER